MSVITKELATHIAKEMTKNKQEAITQLQEAFNKKVLQAYLKQIPAAVKRLKKLHPEYFYKTSRITLHGNGWHYKNVGVSEMVVAPIDGRCYLHLETDLNKELTTLNNTIEKLQDELLKLQREIRSALHSLRTYKRIQEQFAEAAKYLPSAINVALIVNVDDIRKKLN